ncbi:hypothetical protein KY285_030488 [Solanum tuberosum]|nr:hypothetical protein KY285_030488 [Solanum tuberosum]
MWRALRFKLPTNDKIISFGVEPVKCCCCIRQGSDDINHIFSAGYFATHIWKYFSGLFGVDYQYTPLKNHLLKWWSLTPRNEDVMRIIEECRHDIKVNPVTWEKPPPNIFKLNKDGSALTNPGRIGAGGIIRDDSGNVVYAFSIPLGIGTNNLAGIQVVVYGIQWGLHNGYNRLVLECRHIYREANCTADFLVKWSHKFSRNQHFYTSQQLPPAAKGSYVLEKMGMANFRRKKLKRIKHPP